MTELIRPMAEWCAAITEAIGIGLITLSAIYCLVWGSFQRIRFRDAENAARIAQKVRQSLGRGIILGLEFLIGADIIHTVAIDLSYESVGVLGLIVLIRTFLSFTLEAEIEGRWPWQQKVDMKQ